MPTPEDNFRIEVWDADGRTLLETISRSPDFHVSCAAWQAALRRRPGRLLKRWNGHFLIDSLLSPGDVPADPSRMVEGRLYEAHDVALGDLRSWHKLRAWCNHCSHNKDIAVAELTARRGSKACLREIEVRMRCTKCRRGPVVLEIFSAPRG